MTTPFWDEHIFVLASPDALLRGLGRPLVNRLCQEGFTPVAGRLTATTAGMIDELYAEVIAGSWQTWRYRLVDQSFALGPTLALICRYDGPEPDFHTWMRLRKGSSDPFASADGTIRKDFGAINNVLGIMHASDNPDESAKDSDIFGLTEADVTAARGDAVAYVEYLADLSTPALIEQRGYVDVIAGVRARLLLSVLPETSAALLDELREKFPDRSTLGETGAGARLAGLLGVPDDDSLATALTCEFTPQWQERQPRVRIWDVLRQHGVTLDPWERLVLDTSLFFPSVRAAPMPAAIPTETAIPLSGATPTAATAPIPAPGSPAFAVAGS